MKLSIVATLYRSASFIREFCARAAAAARQQASEDYEIVLVNDGSPDNSLEMALDLARSDAHIVVIDLSRNFGHHKAMMAGLSHARGEQVFLIDSDLEEPPECLHELAARMMELSCDVAYGVQPARKGRLFERTTGTVFWKLIGVVSGLPLPANLLTARLMSRRYVDALLLHQEREVFLAGLLYITGFHQAPVLVTKLSRSASTYTFSRKIALFVNSVTSFSNLPLVSIFYVGIGIFLLACFYTGYLVLNRIFFSVSIAGWTSVMASVWLLGGLVVSFMGVIGIYLSKIFSETKQRPNVIVRSVHGRREG